jgi:polyphenol oxidase
VGDDDGLVQENLERTVAALALDSNRLYWLCQAHGCDVRVVRPHDTVSAVRQHHGDGLVAGIAEHACAVRVADCVPLLVGDRQSGMVAAIHAGWRGVVARVVESTLAALRAELGAPGDLVVAIGPHISTAAFEVSEDVATDLNAAAWMDHVVDRTFGPKPHVDLGRILRAQLAAAGVSGDQVDEVAGCTVSDAERFFSFRRDGPRSGRHLAAIVARGRPS